MCKQDLSRIMKKIFCLFLTIIMITGSLYGCGIKDGAGAGSSASSGNTPVILNEVAHSIFYAPMYVAIEEGYFTEEGIDLTLVTGFGADKTMTALLTDEADIGFMGSESTIYTYKEGASDYAVNFAQLTQRAGNFLVSREPIDNFSWDMLIGKDVLGGRAGGMPSHDVTWEHIRGVYERTSRKAPDLKVSKYDEKVVSVLFCSVVLWQKQKIFCKTLSEKKICRLNLRLILIWHSSAICEI